MNTTLLFAEIFIIGLQTNIWMTLLVSIIIGDYWMTTLTSFSLADGQTILVLSSFSVTYAIGIIIDRLADLVFSPWDKNIRKQIITNNYPPVTVIKAHISNHNVSIKHQLEYIRSRIRISRASAINFSIITATGTYYIYQRLIAGSFGTNEAIALAVTCGILATFGALFAYERLTYAFYMLIESNKSIANSIKRTKNKRPKAKR